MIKYIGKCLLIEEEREKVLAIGDIHIGYGREGEAYGALINKSLFDEMMNDMNEVFASVGKVDKIVLLGDLKHSFSNLEKGERYDLVNLFDYLERKAKEIVVIKGNHDNYIINVLSGREIKISDYYIWKEFCFLHGDKSLTEIYDKKVKYWVMGHMHPAIKLREENKSEKYKCFLAGDFKDKKIIILPSFVEAGEGIDVRELDRVLPWEFNLKKFEVFVVSENLQVLAFGRLDKIK